MAMTVQVDIVSIEESLFSGLAEFVVAPAEMGEVGIYPGHAPMITRLKSGVVRLRIPDQKQEEIIYVSSGMLEVQPGRITILSDLALLEQDASESAMLHKKEKVDATLKNRVTDLEYIRMEIELARAFKHLEGIQRLRHRKKRL